MISPNLSMIDDHHANKDNNDSTKNEDKNEDKNE